MMRATALLVLLLLGGCQAASQAATHVQSFTVNDLNVAEADARAHNDVTADCWAGLRGYVQAQVAGLASSIQLARDIVRDEQTRNACAPIALDIMAARTLSLPALLTPGLP